MRAVLRPCLAFALFKISKAAKRLRIGLVKIEQVFDAGLKKRDALKRPCSLTPVVLFFGQPAAQPSADIRDFFFGHGLDLAEIVGMSGVVSLAGLACIGVEVIGVHRSVLSICPSF